MLLNYAWSVCVAAGLALANPISKRSVNFDFGSETLRGVNIGGWLILEPWITPSIFQAQNGSVVGEWTLTEMVPNAGDILKKHWDTWVSLADFQKIAGAGFNVVRVPIGYWAYEKFDNDPFVQGAAPYMDKAIDWARQTGLKVMIDLHGAPGSQNGFDNSGHRTTTPAWGQGDTVKQTLKVLQQISDKYAKAEYQDVVIAIELLNEPLPTVGPSVDTIKQFYRDGFGQVRTVSDTPVVLHDAFQPASSWNGFLTSSDNGAQNVIIDHHEYQVFTNEYVALDPGQHRQTVCNNVGTYASNSDHWVIVGEWTAAQTDCAAALNGYGIGSRYEGYYPGSKFVGSCANVNFIETWSQQFRDDTRAYIEAQLSVFERNTRGWIFWNFKTEASPEWDLFRLLDAGIFPQPLTDRKFGAICS